MDPQELNKLQTSPWPWSNSTCSLGCILVLPLSVIYLALQEHKTAPLPSVENNPEDSASSGY